jgi:hypothetical protein
MIGLQGEEIMIDDLPTLAGNFVLLTTVTG